MHVMEYDIPAIDAYVKRNKHLADTRERELLGEFRMHRWRGASVFALIPGVGMGAIALCAAGFGKRNGYVNVFTLHTDPAFRGQGSMTVLLDHVEEVAREQGLTRLKSKASSEAALRLYHKRGYALWCLTAKGEVLVDTALDSRVRRVESEPPIGVLVAKPALWNRKRLLGVDVAVIAACAECGRLRGPVYCPTCGETVRSGVAEGGQRTFL